MSAKQKAANKIAAPAMTGIDTHILSHIITPRKNRNYVHITLQSVRFFGQVYVLGTKAKELRF